MPPTTPILGIPPNRKVMKVVRTLEALHRLAQRGHLRGADAPEAFARHVGFAGGIEVGGAAPEWRDVVAGGVRHGWSGLRRGGRSTVPRRLGFSSKRLRRLLERAIEPAPRLRRDEHIGREVVCVFAAVA